MHIAAAERPPAWFVPALLAAMLGFAIYAGSVAQTARHDGSPGETQAGSVDRLASDFVASLLLWTRGVHAHAGAANSVSVSIDAAAAVADGAVSMSLQSALLESPIGAQSRRLLQRVIDDRAELVAARDLVVQLRSAGEINRADTEFTTRLQPVSVRLANDAQALKLDVREAASADVRQMHATARRAARAMQVVSMLCLAALLLTLTARRSQVLAGSIVADTVHAPPVNRSSAAIASQTLLKRALREEFAKDAQAQVGTAVRQPIGVDH